MSDFCCPRTVQDVAEVERDDRVGSFEARSEIIEPLGLFQVPRLLVCLRGGERLVGVDVGALEREHELTIHLRDPTIEHLNELPPWSLRKPNRRQAHPPL